jgi:hypothetical protein
MIQGRHVKYRTLEVKFLGVRILIFLNAIATPPNFFWFPITFPHNELLGFSRCSQVAIGEKIDQLSTMVLPFL